MKRVNIAWYLQVVVVFFACSTFSCAYHQNEKERQYRLLVPDVREVLLHRDVVDPGFELGVEELLPFIPHVEHQGAAQEKMLEAEAGCHTAEVK